ncbi:MAG: hypothetical protein EOM54_02680 [Clostridia bacterium]|nr:hypothetical protein [Clostridia bacterium]
MNNGFEQPNMATHPNAFIARHPDLQEFYCVFCSPEAVGEALETSRASVCEYEDGYALLFADGRYVAELDSLFGRLKIHAGISGPFARSSSAYGCAEKARTAAKFGGDLYPDVYLHSYADIRFWAFVELADDILSGEELSIRDFCHSCVFDVCEYDHLEKSRYRETLMAYLSSDCNLRIAAETVGVHRNTLAYRIKRLGELFDIDLSDSNTCFELLFSFTALEAAGVDWDSFRKPAPGEFRADMLRRSLWHLTESRPAGELPGCMCRLFVIDTSELQDDQTADLFCEVENRFSGAAVAYSENYVFVLAEDNSALLEEFKSIVDEEECCGAVSQPFTCGKLKLNFELLPDILAIAKRLYPDISLFYAKDYCSLAFFSYMNRRTSLEPFYCEEVMRVMDHDYRKGTSFAKSFYIYLLSFTDMIGAAHEASIHRNTLEYQIKKALAIADITSPDDRLRFEMLCTYKMLIASGT